MANLILSAFSDEYTDDFDEQLKALKKFDIKFLELRRADGKNVSEMSRGDVLEIKKKIDDNGIKVSSIGSPLGKINIEDDFATHIEMAKRIYEYANILNVNYVRGFSFYLPQNSTRDECRSKVLDGLSKLVDLALNANVTYCHENEALIYGESPSRCYDILEYFGGKMKCVFDMGNFVLDGYKPYPEAYKLLYKYLAYFHIKDSLSAGAIVPAGKGEAHIKEILDDYKKNSDKDIFITLEPHLQTFDGLNALVGKKFSNPYKYDSLQDAFIDAVYKLRELL